jgi:hypothetical protein
MALKMKIDTIENELSDLLLRQSRCSLFFDGAAKGNPGLAGEGGIIKNKVA